MVEAQQCRAHHRRDVDQADLGEWCGFEDPPADRADQHVARVGENSAAQHHVHALVQQVELAQGDGGEQDDLLDQAVDLGQCDGVSCAATSKTSGHSACGSSLISSKWIFSTTLAMDVSP